MADWGKVVRAPFWVRVAASGDAIAQEAIIQTGGAFGGPSHARAMARRNPGPRARLNGEAAPDDAGPQPGE